MPDIQEQVAENRTKARRLNGRFIDLPETANRNLSFARNTIVVDVTVDVYKRGLGNSLISGHPDPQHGSGRGEAGDVRGSWSKVSTTTQSSVLVRQGRNAVRDALDGQAGALREAAVGTSSGTAVTGDTALGSETGRTLAYGIRSTEVNNAVRGRANYGFSEDGLESSDAAEYGLLDESGRLLTHSTMDAVTVAETEELRVDVTLTFNGDSVGESAFTNDGEAALADAMRAVGDVVGINEIAFGTGTTTPSKSDTSLAAEEFRKNALRELNNERIKARVAVMEAEPTTQPVDLTEMGVFDNSSTPRLLWRVTFDAVEKDSGFGFEASASYRIV
jgi:hypothetical protein